MPKNNGSTTNRTVRPDHRAAGNTHTAGHCRVPANVYVVTNLHKVIEFHAFFQDRVLKRATVDAGIRADLTIIPYPNRTQLFDLYPTTTMRRKTETISAQNYTGMQDASLTNTAIVSYCHTSCQHRIRPDDSLRAYNTMRPDTNTGPKHCIAPDDSKWANRHICC